MNKDPLKMRSYKVIALNSLYPAIALKECTGCYQGNPLALKIAFTSIEYLFESNISKFLEQSTTVFKSINVILDQQFNRLSALEKDIMLGLYQLPLVQMDKYWQLATQTVKFS